MDPLQNGLSMLFKRKSKTSVENSIAVVGVTKALLIGTSHDDDGDYDDEPAISKMPLFLNSMNTFF